MSTLPAEFEPRIHIDQQGMVQGQGLGREAQNHE